MQKTLPSTKQKLTKIIGAMPDDLAREVLHYAQYLVAKDADDTEFDKALEAMPNDLAQMFINEAAEAKSSDQARPLFDKHGKLARP